MSPPPYASGFCICLLLPHLIKNVCYHKKIFFAKQNICFRPNASQTPYKTHHRYNAYNLYQNCNQSPQKILFSLNGKRYFHHFPIQIFIFKYFLYIRKPNASQVFGRLYIFIFIFRPLNIAKRSCQPTCFLHAVHFSPLRQVTKVYSKQ